MSANDPLPALGIGIKVFGAVLFVVCAGLLIWSLFRPAVTDGPEPTIPDFPPLAARDASI